MPNGLDERSDRDLIALARRGSLEAAGTLLGRYQRVAYGAALRLLANAAEAEEVAQDALLRAHARLGDLREGELFGPWLRRIAVNASVSLLRRRGRLRFESLDDHLFEPGGRERSHRFVDGRTPESATIEAMDFAEVARLLERLPTDQRVAVVLRDIYGYEMSEIAELARCKLSAAKMRVSRGRAALRAAFEART